MFFYNSDSDFLTAKEKNLYKVFKNSLDTEYKISFSFDQDVNEMTYLAIKKKEFEMKNSFPEVIIAKVDSLKRTSYPYSMEPYSKCLLQFISDKEKDLTDADLNLLYGESFALIKKITSLSREQREKMLSVRNNFVSLVEYFGKENSDEEDESNDIYTMRDLFKDKIDVFINFSCDIRSDISKDPSIKVEVSYKTKNASYDIDPSKFQAFKKCFFQDEIYTLRGKNYKFAEDDFTENSKRLNTAAMKYFEINMFYYGNYIYINKSRLFSFLYDCRGCSIYFDGEEVRIDENIEKGDVYLESDGVPHLIPSIDRNNKIIFAKKGKDRIIIDLNKYTAAIYRFEKIDFALIYDFFYENGMDSFNYIKDIFVKKLLPTIGTSIVKIDSEKENNNFTINLYIDLDEKNQLITKTIYKINNVEVDRDKIPSNPYFDACLGAYSKALNDLNLKESGIETDLGVVYYFLKADLSNIKKVAKIFLSDVLAKMKIKNSSVISISVSRNAGWLNATIDSEDYSQDELKDMLAAYKKKKKYYILNGNMILLDDQLGKVSKVMDEIDVDFDTLTAEQIPFFEAFKLKDSGNENLRMQLSNDLMGAIKNVINYKNQNIEFDSRIEASLREYQKDGIKWMLSLYNNNLDGILADDMGLGKTLETIAFISKVDKNMPILIACPTSVVYNWAREFKMWNPSQRCVTIEGNKEYRTTRIAGISNNDKTVYVTSYDSLRNDLSLYEGKSFSVFIIDEAQYIKNALALKAKAVKKISCLNRFALTGTPLENRLSDLWSIFDFLMPGYLGDYDEFRAEFEQPITEDPHCEKQKELLLRITPFILRRTKNEVLKSLPPKTTSIISVTMNEKERKLYVAYLQKAREALGADIGKISFLAALGKLREICVDASSFFEGFDDESSKLSLALNLIQESIENGHKVLVFSFFSSVLPKIKNKLKNEYNITSKIIDGSTKSNDRVSLANDFNSPSGVKVMLVSLKAGGTGLNLIGADTVVHLDPWWNFAAEEQATDRAYRIGQTKPVTVYKLVCHDSVEERVIDLQNAKKELYDSVIKDGDNVSSMSEKDYKFILS